MNLSDKVRNLISKIQGGSYAAFSEFLTMEEQVQSVVYLRKSGLNYGFFGGYDNSDRKILGVYESGDISHNLYPIETLQIHCGQKISHSDILGSILSLNVRRDVIGDILVTDSGYFVFVDKKIMPFLCTNLEKIRNYKVKVELYEGPKLTAEEKFETKKIIVSSLRLDCVAGAILNISRNRINDLILSQRVLINHEICLKRERLIQPEDIITIRKSGKYIVRQISGVTKKQRLILEIDKYV